MGKINVTATVPEKKDGKGVIVQKAIGPFTISVDCPDTAADMIKKFGDESVKANAIANWIVSLQSNLRGGMKRGETQAQLQARLGNALMGVAQRGVKLDPEQAFIAMFENADPAKQAEMLAALKSKAKK